MSGARAVGGVTSTPGGLTSRVVCSSAAGSFLGDKVRAFSRVSLGWSSSPVGGGNSIGARVTRTPTSSWSFTVPA